MTIQTLFSLLALDAALASAAFWLLSAAESPPQATQFASYTNMPSRFDDYWRRVALFNRWAAVFAGATGVSIAVSGLVR